MVRNLSLRCLLLSALTLPALSQTAGIGLTISSINPNTAPAGSPGINMDIFGTSFQSAATCVNQSTATWTENGVAYPLSTVFITATRLQAVIPPTLLTSAGAATITVTNSYIRDYESCYNYMQIPDKVSNGLAFTVTNSLPTLQNLTPADGTACGPGFSIAATGSNFVQPAAIYWQQPNSQNAFSINTTPDPGSPTTRLRGDVPMSYIGIVGQATVFVVYTPTTTQQYISNGLPFNIRKTPQITTISPLRVTAGGNGFTLTVNGTNFDTSLTTVRWVSSNAVADLSVAASPASTQLQVQVPKNLIASAGTAQIYVVNKDGANPSGTLYPTSCSAPQTFTVDAVNLQVNSLSLPDGIVNTAYPNQNFAASGGAPPYTKWAVSAGGLPPGLSLSTAGVLSGTPATAGSYNFTVQVTDSANATATGNFTINILPAFGIASPTGGALPAATVNVSYPAQTFTAIGGTTPYTWDIAQGSVPGLSLTTLTNGTAQLQGTPTTAGPYTIAVRVKDKNGLTAQMAYTLTVNLPALQITAPNVTALPAGVVASPYAQTTFSATGGMPPYNWDLSAGSIPGLSLSTAGVLSGTPTAAGTFTLTVRATDSASQPTASTRTYTLTVSLPPPPQVNVSFSTSSGNVTDQPTVSIKLGSPYALDLQGTLQLNFMPNAAGLPASGYKDPAAVFAASGAATQTFTVKAGDTLPSLPSIIAIQQGTVAGTLSITLSDMRIAGTNTTITPTLGPPAQITIDKLPPVIVAGSVAITGLSATGFSVELDGFSTPRDLQRASLTFTPAAGAQLSGNTTVAVSLSNESASWYGSTDGRNSGSRFHLKIPFALSGDTTAIGTVSATLTNSVAGKTSNTVSGGVK